MSDLAKEIIAELRELKKELAKLACPRCFGELIKKPGSGEHIKHCKECGTGWFLLQTSKGKDFSKSDVT